MYVHADRVLKNTTNSTLAAMNKADSVAKLVKLSEGRTFAVHIPFTAAAATPTVANRIRTMVNRLFKIERRPSPGVSHAEGNICPVFSMRVRHSSYLSVTRVHGRSQPQCS